MIFYNISLIQSVVLLLIAIQYTQASEWKVNFENESYTMYMGESKKFFLSIKNLNKIELLESNATIRLLSLKNILRVTTEIPVVDIEDDEWTGSFNVDALFIGKSSIYVEVQNNQSAVENSSQQMIISIKHKGISNELFLKCFNIIASVFYFVMYVNTGIVLDLKQVKSIIRNPWRPFIALTCNFIITPLVRYFIH